MSLRTLLLGVAAGLLDFAVVLTAVTPAESTTPLRAGAVLLTVALLLSLWDERKT